jgi:hypothetical protein
MFGLLGPDSRGSNHLPVAGRATVVVRSRTVRRVEVDVDPVRPRSVLTRDEETVFRTVSSPSMSLRAANLIGPAAPRTRGLALRWAARDRYFSFVLTST